MDCASARSLQTQRYVAQYPRDIAVLGRVDDQVPEHQGFLPAFAAEEDFVVSAGGDEATLTETPNWTGSSALTSPSSAAPTASPGSSCLPAIPRKW